MLFRSNCTTIAVNGTCTVTVKFTPTAATNTGTLTVNSNANNNPLTVGLSGNGITSTTNLALNQPITASSSTSSSFSPQMANDGNTSTYWESTDGAGYPQTITLKVFLTADPQARALRRAAEQGHAVDATEAAQARRDRLDAAQ